MTGTISRIIKPFGPQTKKDGTTYGPAQMVEVELSNGETVSTMLWEEKAIGEVLELEKNGQYWNVPKKPKAVVNVDLEPVLKALRELFKQNRGIARKVDLLLGIEATTEIPTESPKPKTGYDKFKEIGETIKLAPHEDELGNVDIVADMPDDDEPINLDHIPF